MTIHVTEDHIDNGIREDCKYCPVALALNEATNWRWRVTDKALYFLDNGIWTFYQFNSFRTGQWIYNFDRNYGWPKPFSFNLRED